MNVAAVLVTRGAILEPRAVIAARAFLSQTWPAHLRELLILNTGEPLGVTAHGVREFFINPAQIGAGELRNFAFIQARADWLLTWSANAWHHPRRMEEQMRFREPGAAVVLSRAIATNAESGETRIHFAEGGHADTILHSADDVARYDDAGDAAAFLSQYARRVTLSNRAEILVTFHAGAPPGEPATVAELGVLRAAGLAH